MSYTVGTKVTIETTLKDADGVLTDATVSVAVTKPDGTAVSPAPTVSNPSVGSYTAQVTTDQVGTWLVTWTASGALVAVKDDQFSVVAARILVASLQELKSQVNRTGTTDDEELRTYLEAATDFVEWAIGGPLGGTTYTERAVAIGGTLVLSQQPVISVTSVTPVTNGVLGTALASTLYRIDDRTKMLELFSTYGWHQHEVVYRAGRTAIPAGMKLAGLIIAQHLWQTQSNNAGGRPPIGDDGTVFLPGAAFAIPHRAAELLKTYMMSGVA